MIIRILIKNTIAAFIDKSGKTIVVTMMKLHGRLVPCHSEMEHYDIKKRLSFR